ncbi:MAG: Asp-tRNA(Asn)/Glu-tRNA(Gln) amidotransferase GatCAB subunit C [Verrucomicrobiales bacterium]|jgi:aspartyl-tRNA(Asn)/glutamyl-tRNA(Gln) amidotransferase subunit C|nr:Asp-tRNA(Asn)/Glu-tRNA(Gln) amidotransferase GatCAB subunit C [Verrucomicrobiales bacterium]|tara:strand:+ start:7400 stop:7675 length:276 start_codon:yes stop_codon:yes gene_type:complete
MDVRKVAHLARIELADREIEEYQGQMNQILQYVEQLNTINVEGIEPTAHAVPVFDVVREDKSHGPGLSQDAVLSNAPATAHDQIKMPKVVE